MRKIVYIVTFVFTSENAQVTDCVACDTLTYANALAEVMRQETGVHLVHIHAVPV